MGVILQFDEYGGPEVLRFREVAPPAPGPGEVLYRVEAFAINRGDLFWMADTYYNAARFPARVGQEACGVVEAVGAGVTQFAPGDRVASIVQEDGRYCVDGEWAVSLEKYLVPWHAFLSPEEGCAMWSQAITAYYPFVEIARLTGEDTVLVTAGSSTSGNGAIQMAKLLGAKVFATSRTDEKREFLLRLGADAVITETEDLAPRVLELSEGKGATVVFDTVVGPLVARYLECLAYHARVYLVGALSGDLQISFPWLALVRPGASITGYSLYNHNRDDGQLTRAKDFIGSAIEERALRPVIDRVFPFADTVAAYRYMQTGAQRGKIIVRVRAA